MIVTKLWIMMEIMAGKSFEMGNPHHNAKMTSTDPRSEPGYEPRMMAQPLPLSTTRALQELEDQGASLPLHGCFGCMEGR